MKKHTSLILKTIINNSNFESRKEWMMWMFEKAGKKNSNNKDWHPDRRRDWQQHNKPL
jgi:putative transposase